LRNEMQTVLSKILIILLLSNNIFAMSQKKEADSSNQIYQVIPFILGAALITWGAYELGNTVEESQRNVAILWGSTAIASTGIILYQSSLDKGVALSIKPVQKSLPVIAINYRF